MCNVGLATAVCNGLVARLNSSHPDNPLVSPLPPVYYLKRQLMVAYHYPEFRRPLCDLLKTYSDTGGLRNSGELSGYLAVGATYTLRRAHNIHDMCAERIPYTDDLHYDGPPPKPRPPRTGAWQFQDQLTWKLTCDRENGVEGEPDADFHEFGDWIENRRDDTQSTSGNEHDFLACTQQVADQSE